MEEVRWTIGQIGDAPPAKRKAKHADLQQITDKMTKGQVAGVTQWNDMVTILRENNLMEER